MSDKGCTKGQPLRVLMAGNDPSVRGGITSVIGQIAGHDWSASHIHVELIPTYIESGRIRQTAFFLHAMHAFRTRLRRNPPDLVHIHMSYRGSFLRKNNIRRLCLRHSVPYVVHLHGSQFRDWYADSGPGLQAAVRRMLREAASVIVMGDRWESIIREIEPAARVRVICNAVPVPARRYPSAADTFQVLYLGVLIPRKGVRDLVEAVHLLRERGQLGGMHFVIAGAGEEETSIRELTRQYELEEDITFTGWAGDARKEELLRAAGALVLPSYQEGLPVAVLEAMARGIPVIATDVGDTAMAVRDGETGYLIPPGDPEQLAARLTDLIADPERYDRMSRAARHLAETDFSEDRLFRQLEACWREAGRKDGGSGYFRGNP